MMKKLAVALAAVVMLFNLCGSAPADEKWDSFVAEMEARIKIKEEGKAIFNSFAMLAPEGDAVALWRISCGDGDARRRAAASSALVQKWFPGGDPAEWEQVNGFFPSNSYVPMQIVAMNALFNAVEALSELPDGKFAAAWLMLRLGESSRGKLLFVDTMPARFREVLDRLVAETSMPGDWQSSRIEGPYPFVPVYNGTVLFDRAVTEGYQFLDGHGGLAANGPYAWDRANGYLYRVVDPSEFDIELN